MSVQDPSVRVFPSGLVERAQWLTWARTDDGRKVPRAPHANESWRDKYVDPHNPENHTDFETAMFWVDRLPNHRLAYDIRNRDDHPEEDTVLLDYDDVRDPETGDIHPVVREHMERAGTYAAISSSGTGVHVLGVLPDGFPDGVQAIESPLDLDTSRSEWPDAEIEGYCTKRFVGLTGWHIESTPDTLADISEFIADLCEEYATKSAAAPTDREPVTPREELQDVEHTDDIQDVYDAIEQTRPHEIRLRSTVTNERPGSKDMDPSWSRSKSGTRLAQLSDGWIYRQGMHSLDALQVVALEEGIITQESEYPSGQTFFRAVDALRDRGAHIPRLVDPEERDALERNAADADGPDEETLLTLSGPLALRSTRKRFTRCCPACDVAVTDDHASDCDLNSVPMATVNQAYQTIIDQLHNSQKSLSQLRSDVANWGPLHERIVKSLIDAGAIAPAGQEVVA